MDLGRRLLLEGADREAEGHSLLAEGLQLRSVSTRKASAACAACAGTRRAQGQHELLMVCLNISNVRMTEEISFASKYSANCAIHTRTNLRACCQIIAERPGRCTCTSARKSSISCQSWSCTHCRARWEASARRQRWAKTHARSCDLYFCSASRPSWPASVDSSVVLHGCTGSRSCPASHCAHLPASTSQSL